MQTIDNIQQARRYTQMQKHHFKLDFGPHREAIGYVCIRDANLCGDYCRRFDCDTKRTESYDEQERENYRVVMYTLTHWHTGSLSC